ncbi:MAG: hypothetical protein GY830_03290 [Bacteroidetes bacterium]|nr:hypothetical protein [Bacteroidota bacterium]
MIANIDTTSLLIVGAFLLITLFIGLWAGRNVKTFKEYALGKRFSPVSLTLTILATWIGGQSIIGSIGDIYRIGILSFIPWIAVCIQLVLIGLIFSKSISKFKGSYTAGDLMEKFYGTKAKILTGACITIWDIFNISIQLLMLGRVFENFYNIDKYWAVIIGGIIVVIYAFRGGVTSVVSTDVFQFTIMIIAIPTIATVLIHKIGGYKELIHQLPSNKLSIFSNPEFKYWIFYAFFFKCFSFHTLLDATILQRVFIANGAKEIRNKFFSLSLFNLVVGILFTLIGLSMIVLFQSTNHKSVIFHTINSLYFSSISKGLIISGFLAIIMSTVDSYLNACGIVFFNDVIKPVFKVKENKSLFGVKLITLIIAIISVFTTLFFVENSYYRNIPFHATLILFPSIAFPFLIGILGIKTNLKAFIVGAIIGVSSSFVVVYGFPYLKPFAIIIGIITNAITYMISHIIQNKGILWLKADQEQGKKLEVLWIFNFKNFFSEVIRSFSNVPKTIYSYSQNQIMKYGSYNYLFGIYCCINFTLPYFFWESSDPYEYNLMLKLRVFGGVLGALLIVKDAWNDFFKPFYHLFWHFSLIYCLPFITTIMFLLTKGSNAWLLNVGASIFFLVMLVAGEVFLILAPLGIGLGLIFYNMVIGPVSLPALGFDVNYYLVYQILFSTIIALLFAYRKKFFYMIKSNQGVNLGLSMGHELKNTGLNILPYSQVSNLYINNAKEVIYDDKKQFILDERSFGYIKENNDYIKALSEQMLRIVKSFERLMIEYRDSLSNPELCSLKELIEDTIKQYHFGPGQKEKLHTELSQDFRLKVPKRVFIFVIDNIIRNAFKHGRPNRIDIWIEGNELHIKDDGMGVPPNKLSDIFRMFYTTGDKTSSGIGLAFAKQIIETVNGEIWCDSQTGEGSFTEFIIKFPAILFDVTDEELKEHIAEESEKKRSKVIAKNMIIKGIDKDTIAEVTQLDNREIDSL